MLAKIKGILAGSDVEILIWRVALAPGLTDSYYTITRKWSLLDLVEAHKALDLEAKIKTVVVEEQTSKLGK